MQGTSDKPMSAVTNLIQDAATARRARFALRDWLWRIHTAASSRRTVEIVGDAAGGRIASIALTRDGVERASQNSCTGWLPKARPLRITLSITGRRRGRLRARSLLAFVSPTPGYESTARNSLAAASRCRVSADHMSMFAGTAVKRSASSSASVSSRARMALGSKRTSSRLTATMSAGTMRSGGLSPTSSNVFPAKGPWGSKKWTSKGPAGHETASSTRCSKVME